MKDWLDAVRRDYHFRIIIWEDIDLKREARKCLKSISERFPNIIKQNEVVQFYEMEQAGKTYYVMQLRSSYILSKQTILALNSNIHFIFISLFKERIGIS